MKIDVKIDFDGRNDWGMSEVYGILKSVQHRYRAHVDGLGTFKVLKKYHYARFHNYF